MVSSFVVYHTSQSLLRGKTTRLKGPMPLFAQYGCGSQQVPLTPTYLSQKLKSRYVISMLERGTKYSTIPVRFGLFHEHVTTSLRNGGGPQGLHGTSRALTRAKTLRANHAIQRGALLVILLSIMLTGTSLGDMIQIVCLRRGFELPSPMRRRRDVVHQLRYSHVSVSLGYFYFSLLPPLPQTPSPLLPAPTSTAVWGT